VNSFYRLPKFWQWLTAIIMAALALAAIALWFVAIDVNPLFYFLLFVLVPIMQFLSTPILTITGVYRYQSPMLLVFNANDKIYDLHNGTTFDYLFLLRKPPRYGKGLQVRILIHFLDGLLVIVDKIEREVLSKEVVIRGSSYFFSERTAHRLGFTVSPTSAYEKINILINYLDLLWMYSLAKGKLSFPNLGAIKTASISGSTLVEKKEALIRLKETLSQWP
jgi:hypothetical protein